MSWYRQRVERDLTRWLTAGWVNETGAAAIRADLQARKSPFGAASIFAMLGAVLFGFAIMSFVAAHWTGMTKLARLALLLVVLWGCYGAAAALFQRQMAAFAHAAVLGGIAVYGASIMLIAQMYHMEGNPPDAALLWALGALLAAVLAGSNAALAATFVLICVWSSMERTFSMIPHWNFLPVWAVVTGVAVWLRWRPSLHMAAPLSLVFWLVPLGYFVLDHHAHWVVILAGALAATGAATAGPAIDRHVAASQATFAYGLTVAFAGLLIMQFIDDFVMFGTQSPTSIGPLLLLAVLTLALLLAAMLWALHSENRAALWLAYAGFALEIFMLYVKTFGSLLNTSLFFLVAAIIVSLLAWAAYRLHQRKSMPGAAA